MATTDVRENEDRVRDARKVLKFYVDLFPEAEYAGEDSVTALVDLTADLLHLAHDLGMGDGELIFKAANHYDEERRLFEEFGTTSI